GKPIKSYFQDDIIHNQPMDFQLKSSDGINISIDNIYQINNKTYLSLQEVFTGLDIPFKLNENGRINIGRDFNLTLGSTRASFKDDDFNLTNEPIIYKSDVYLSQDDLILILEKDYEINESDNFLDLNLLENKGQDKEKSADINNDFTKQSNQPPLKPIMLGGIVIIIILLV